MNLRPLLREIHAFNTADTIEENNKKRLLQLIEYGSNIFDRRSIKPGHITASAFILDPHHRCLLMVFHSKLKRWLQPGGHVEKTDMSLQFAATREVKEETNLRILEPARLIDIDIHPIPANKKTGSHLHFDVRYLFFSTMTKVSPGSDALEAKWISLNELSQGQRDRGMIRVLSKLKRL